MPLRRPIMPKYKHLLLSDRITIEHALKDSLSFKAIGKELNKDCTTISKEIRNHISFKKSGTYGSSFNNCIHRKSCSIKNICTPCTVPVNRYCLFCGKCISLCDFYEKESCAKITKSPYVCNGCSDLKRCSLEKVLYSASYAQKEYELFSSESRRGISICEEEADALDRFISPLIRKGQSIHHICSNNPDAIMHSEKTIYNYIQCNLFSARNIDLPRKVRYRPRKTTNRFKVDRSCRINRTYDDFLAYLQKNPDVSIVEMDSVEGVKGGKVLLTIHFKSSQLMLAFLRDKNDSRSVLNIFENLYLQLCPETFNKLFLLILTDNGSEFSNPSAIEFDMQGNRRTYIFFCDPQAPYQKGAAENNHQFIRRIVPKGSSFDTFTQSDINLMMNHINSYSRKKLNNRTPYDVFSFFQGLDVVRNLGLVLIPPNEIVLQPVLLKK